MICLVCGSQIEAGKPCPVDGTTTEVEPSLGKAEFTTETQPEKKVTSVLGFKKKKKKE